MERCEPNVQDLMMAGMLLQNTSSFQFGNPKYVKAVIAVDDAIDFIEQTSPTTQNGKAA